MAQIIIDIESTKKGLEVDIDQTVQAINKKEDLMVKDVMIALRTMIDIQEKDFNYNVQKTEITKIPSNNENTKNVIVNRIIEYDL